MTEPAQTERPTENALFRFIAPRERSSARLVIIVALLLLWLVVLTILYLATDRNPREQRGIAMDATQRPACDGAGERERSLDATGLPA